MERSKRSDRVCGSAPPPPASAGADVTHVYGDVVLRSGQAVVLQSSVASRAVMSQRVPLNITIAPEFDANTDTMYDNFFDFDYDPKVLDGLTGVPTRTTATLTPTTLRNIEQTFIDLQCTEESHHNQAGFVPPVLQPVPHGNNSLFMSLVDQKGWGGGSTVIADSHSSNDSSMTLHSPPSVTPPTTTRRNTGGRRPIKDKNISPEEEERRQVRRERNKQAAARCRKRRLDHTNELIEETEGLEEKKQSLQQEIQQLQMEKDDLEFILEAHKVNCRLARSNSPPDVKPFVNAPRMLVVKEDPECAPPQLKKVARPRPTSLPVAAFNPRKLPSLTVMSTTEVAGVPISTPTAGMPFNFDSLMDGGTGLTPVSGPLVPSCASQQRTGCVDLSSPDTLPTSKLVSL